MEADLEIKAKEAFLDDNSELAVSLYTQAIDMDPKNACLFSDRAQANNKLQNYTEAIADASRAIELDPSMAKAYLRKGIACIKLEEYQTAKVALEAGAALAPGDSRFTKLIKECEKQIAEETSVLPKELSSSNPVSCSFGSQSSDVTKETTKDAAEPRDEKPHQPTVATPSSSNPVSCSFGSQSSDVTKETTKDAEPRDEKSHQLTVATPAKPKYRHEYYQKPEEVVVTIFAKGMHDKNVVVDFGEQIFSITIDIPGEDAYRFQPRLFGKIIPEKCRYDVMPTKIEIRLAKAEMISWTSLEFTSKITVPQKINVSSDAGFQRPSYPSSKSRDVDWDKLEAQVKKEEKEEKLDGDAALNKLFRNIYQDADDDIRRAMRKSFVESNGTVLSTNWKEVSSKKVESTPPNGMEVKKWEY